MTEVDAAVNEYSKTIHDLQMRLGNMAAALFRAEAAIAAQTKEIEGLKPPITEPAPE